MASIRRSVVALALLSMVATVTYAATPEAEAVSSVDIVILGGQAVVSSQVEAQLASCTLGSVTRQSGNDRYQTAGAVSAAAFTSATTAFIATGSGFPDAIAGGSAAAIAKGPVLLVNDGVPGSTARELQRLGVSNIQVLGGSSAVSDSVVAKLRQYGATTRIAGADRYATAAAIAKARFASAETVYIAAGTNFPDALAAIPAATQDEAPILLVRNDGIPGPTAAQLARLRPRTVKILGGTAAVSAAVAQSLTAYAPNVVRLAGPNRYATAGAISKDAFPGGAPKIFIATGDNFPDALAGGAAAGVAGAPILLVSQNDIPNPTMSEIQRLTGRKCGVKPPPNFDERVQTTLDGAAQQLKNTVAGLPSAAMFPRSTEPATGKWKRVGATDWTSGFFPALLWRMYLGTGDPEFLSSATKWSGSLASQASRTDTHDVGFMVGLPASLAFEATGNAAYRNTLLEAANSLSTRFDPDVGATRSWSWGRWATDFNVIIDNMMNLNLFWEGAEMTLNPAQNVLWLQQARSHAAVTAQQHIRADGSSYHNVVFNETTGQVISRETHSGVSDESTWSRGQAWGLYGFTAAADATGDPARLADAKKMADFFLNRLPADSVPYWDFDAAGIPNVPRDSSAAAIAAAGLLDLSQVTNNSADSYRYFYAAVAILDSLMSPTYLSDGIVSEGILLHGTGSARPSLNSEVDVSLIWGDYYFVEALQRYQEIAKTIPAVGTCTEPFRFEGNGQTRWLVPEPLSEFTWAETWIVSGGVPAYLNAPIPGAFFSHPSGGVIDYVIACKERPASP